MIYSPCDIMMKSWEMDAAGHPALTCIKLRQYSEELQRETVVVWTREQVETWDVSGSEPKRIKEASFAHNLGEIPIAFFNNGGEE